MLGNENTENEKREHAALVSFEPLEKIIQEDGDTGYGLIFNADGLLPLLWRCAETAFLTQGNVEEHGDESDIGAILNCKLIFAKGGQVALSISQIMTKPGFNPFEKIITPDIMDAQHLLLSFGMMLNAFDENYEPIEIADTAWMNDIDYEL